MSLHMKESNSGNVNQPVAVSGGRSHTINPSLAPSSSGPSQPATHIVSDQTQAAEWLRADCEKLLVPLFVTPADSNTT